MESRIDVKPIKIDIFCDECCKKPNPGCILIYDSISFTYPAKYNYHCSLCNKKFTFDQSYPYYDFVEIMEQ